MDPNNTMPNVGPQGGAVAGAPDVVSGPAMPVMPEAPAMPEVPTMPGTPDLGPEGGAETKMASAPEMLAGAVNGNVASNAGMTDSMPGAGTASGVMGAGTRDSVSGTEMVGSMPSAMNPATMATPGAMPEVPAMAPETLAMPEMPNMTDAGMPTFDPMMMNLGATDPITMQEAPKAPDPVEEELKMPLKAAGPVPGSIGSAVSMPSAGSQTAAMAGMAPGQQTPSVAFNDPAMMPQNTTAGVAQPAKKLSKSTMILLGVLGGVVILALVVILIAQLI